MLQFFRRNIIFLLCFFCFFFFNDTATTEIYTLSLHDALPISHSLGSVSEQSASLPGRRPASSPLFLRTSSRALRAASRARAALSALAMIDRAMLGFLSKKAPRASLTTVLTMPSTSELPSLVLV